MPEGNLPDDVKAAQRRIAKRQAAIREQCGRLLYDATKVCQRQATLDHAYGAAVEPVAYAIYCQSVREVAVGWARLLEPMIDALVEAGSDEPTCCDLRGLSGELGRLIDHDRRRAFDGDVDRARGRECV